LPSKQLRPLQLKGFTCGNSAFFGLDSSAAPEIARTRPGLRASSAARI
jgi:hypothetical protein